MIVAKVRYELLRATLKHPPIRSAHEAYAILREELDGALGVPQSEGLAEAAAARGVRPARRAAGGARCFHKITTGASYGTRTTTGQAPTPQPAD